MLIMRDCMVRAQISCMVHVQHGSHLSLCVVCAPCYAQCTEHSEYVYTRRAVWLIQLRHPPSPCILFHLQLYMQLHIQLREKTERASWAVERFVCIWTREQLGRIM